MTGGSPAGNCRGGRHREQVRRKLMKCPGQDSRYWDPNAIFDAKCPECGTAIEFFKDESKRKCRKCGTRVLNPRMDFGCASYCRYAEQCLGEIPPELAAKRDDLLRDRAAVEMKKRFGQDFKKIGRATRMARYAERIARAENADAGVVLLGAYLHDLVEGGPGIQDGEAPERTETPREVLARLGARTPIVEAVWTLLRPGRREADSANARCLADALAIVELEEMAKEQSPKRLDVPSEVSSRVSTEAGRQLAAEVLNART